MRKLTLFFAAIAAVILSAAAWTPAPALSIDDARAACIARVRPSVIACVRANVIAYGAPPRAYVAQCREPAIPRVRACVFRTLAANGHPALAGRALPRLAAACPLGFDGCMSRCHHIGGFGMAPAGKSCGRVCAARCGGGWRG